MAQAHSHFELLGKGVYSFSDAARFIGAPARRVRQWVGRTPVQSQPTRTPMPLWVSELAPAGTDGISFKDLIELRFVNAFRAAGVSLAIIRRTLEVARDEFQSEYPLTSQRFQTDGKALFLEVVETSGSRSLVDLVRRQNVIQKVVGPSLRQGVDLSVEGDALRWYPVRHSQVIVLDPARRMGDSILTESGVPTVALEAAVTAEGGDQKRVARMFRVPVAAVRAAVAFEHRIRGA